MRAVRFDEYGGVEVLEVGEVEDPAPAPGRAIVRVGRRASTRARSPSVRAT
jgi:NADPH:quinone reductase-like Zn-dependent oxidoreductase